MRLSSTRSDRPRAGFTLIELLIVVLIIGILAAVAIPKFQNTKGKAFAASLKSDLHNLATAEESYFYDNTTYTTDVSDLKFSKSAGVVITVLEASGKGWAAVATHPASYPLTCAIYMGTVVGPTSPATAEGQVGCQ